MNQDPVNMGFWRAFGIYVLVALAFSDAVWV